MKSKPRINLDVDGVVANFAPHLFATMGIPDRAITQYELAPLLSIGELERYTELMSDSNFWLTLPVMDGAKEAVAELAEHFNILWLTSPADSCKEWAWARKRWLLEHFGAAGRDVMIGARKEEVFADFFIDDKPENVIAWQHCWRNGVALLYDQSWNKSATWTRRFTWGDGVLEIE